MNAFRKAALLVPVLLLPVAAVAQTAAWDSAITSFRSQLRADVAADDVGGISAAVVAGDRVVWAEGFGWADREAGIPAGVETIYRTGSISKSFTAVALMQQVERGVIALDDAVVSALPEVGGFADRSPDAPDITFRQLASHTAGLAREPELRRHLVKGYLNRGEGGIDTRQPFIEHRGRGYKVPNGGVYSTVLDLGRFVAGMTGAAGHVMLGPASRRAVMTVQTPEDPDNGYGLGFAIRTTDDGRRLVGHGGSVAGYTAYLLFEPESRIGVVLLRNYNRGATDLSDAAAELLVALTADR